MAKWTKPALIGNTNAAIAAIINYLDEFPDPVQLIQVAESGAPLPSEPVAPVHLTTVGAGVLTAALLLGGNITRTGPTAGFIDTTDTAANIQAAWAAGYPSAVTVVRILNETAYAQTLAGGTGVTVVGQLVVAANASAKFLITWIGPNLVTLQALPAEVFIPPTKFSTSSVTTGSLAAGLITGAQDCVWLQTGATPGAQLVRTAAQMLGDVTGGAVGMISRFRIINTGAGTLTLTADAGATVTLVGTMTVPQNTYRDFTLQINSATTATITSVGAGAS